jgi:hypothetical protein
LNGFQSLPRRKLRVVGEIKALILLYQANDGLLLRKRYEERSQDPSDIGELLQAH